MGIHASANVETTRLQPSYLVDDRLRSITYETDQDTIGRVVRKYQIEKRDQFLTDLTRYKITTQKLLLETPLLQKLDSWFDKDFLITHPEFSITEQMVYEDLTFDNEDQRKGLSLIVKDSIESFRTDTENRKQLLAVSKLTEEEKQHLPKIETVIDRNNPKRINRIIPRIATAQVAINLPPFSLEHPSSQTHISKMDGVREFLRRKSRFYSQVQEDFGINPPSMTEFQRFNMTSLGTKLYQELGMRLLAIDFVLQEKKKFGGNNSLHDVPDYAWVTNDEAVMSNRYILLTDTLIAYFLHNVVYGEQPTLRELDNARQIGTSILSTSYSIDNFPDVTEKIAVQFFGGKILYTVYQSLFS